MQLRRQPHSECKSIGIVSAAELRHPPGATSGFLAPSWRYGWRAIRLLDKPRAAALNLGAAHFGIRRSAPKGLAAPCALRFIAEIVPCTAIFRLGPKLL